LLVACCALIQLTSGAVIYTRWGRTSCPLGVALLLSGYVGKGHYDHTGSGQNYVCIHSKPKFGTGNLIGSQSDSGWIYGVEYQFYQGYTKDKPFSWENNDGDNLHDNDAVCAVCYKSEASAQYMNVGRPDCPGSDMTLEYSGYLASERHNHPSGSNYVCLDSAPEARQGGQADQNGGLFYPVQAGCGSLPCPPFTEGYELTCAVCTI